MGSDYTLWDLFVSCVFLPLEMVGGLALLIGVAVGLIAILEWAKALVRRLRRKR